MNKYILTLIILSGAGALLYYLLEGRHNDESPQEIHQEMSEDITIGDVHEELQEDWDRPVYGSCNAIADSSTCLDYVGSMWSENNMAELNCAGSGVFSHDPCPTSPFGGCQTGGGTTMEMTAWLYREGDGEVTEESIPHAQNACNANPMAQWVSPQTS